MKKWIVLGAALSFSVSAWAHHDGTDHDHDHSHQAHGQHESIPAATFDKATLNNRVHIDQCWVRLLPGTVPSAAYFVVNNQGQDDVALIGARSPAYDDVMVHETTQKDGMSHMGHTASVAIAAGQSVSFEPGGLHVMLEQANQALQQGGTIDLELLYEDHSKSVTTCQLRSPKTQAY